jgi:hypothetical protein
MRRMSATTSSTSRAVMPQRVTARTLSLPTGSIPTIENADLLMVICF